MNQEHDADPPEDQPPAAPAREFSGFVWDEAKRLANIAKHRIDFDAARSLFDGRPYSESISSYPDETRLERTGIIEGRYITVIWTARGTSIRIISARIARHDERRRYQGVLDSGA